MFGWSGNVNVTTSSFTNCQSSGSVSHDQNETLRCIAPCVAARGDDHDEVHDAVHMIWTAMHMRSAAHC